MRVRMKNIRKKIIEGGGGDKTKNKGEKKRRERYMRIKTIRSNKIQSAD